MKANIFKKSKNTKMSELLEMSKDDMKTIEGGIWYMIRRGNGTIGFVWRNEEK